MEPEDRFREIKALLHDVAQLQKQAELRMEAFDRRMEAAEARAATAESRIERAEARLEKSEARLEKAEARLEKAEARLEKSEVRLEKAEARMEKMDQKWDKRFEATRKLVQEGIKFIMRRDQQRDAKFAALVQTVDKLAKAQQALLDSLRMGGNGNAGRRG